MLEVALPTRMDPEFDRVDQRREPELAALLNAHVTDTMKLANDVIDAFQPRKETSKKGEVNPIIANENDEGDSDYLPEEESTSEEEGADDGNEQSLEEELDEIRNNCIEGDYLTQMLAARNQLPSEEAVWVDKFIQKQREWREQNGESIDAFHLPGILRVKQSKLIKKQSQQRKRPRILERYVLEEDTLDDRTSVMWWLWTEVVMPCLPLSLQKQRAESVLSGVLITVFVGLALGIQVYVALQPSQYN